MYAKVPACVCKLKTDNRLMSNIDFAVMPVNTHGATITVKDGGGKSIVEWKGAFYRSFPGPNPPPELSDETASKVLSEFYTAGLEKIKALAEK